MLDYTMPYLNFDVSDFFELTPDLVCIAGKDGFLKKVNSAVKLKLGYTEEELYSRPISDLVHPADREITLHTRLKMLNGEVLHNFCNRYLTKTGEIIWLEWTSVYIADKEIVFAIAKDITKRKLIEAEVEENYIKFKELASHFKDNIEKDRKYFAYELHEDLAQLVASVNLDLGWMKNNSTDLPGKFSEKIDHASAVSKLLIKTIQRLSFAISPQMLDNLGLNTTLDWLCKEFTTLYGITCSFKAAYDELSLSNEIKIDFFRICQDTLNAVLHHEQAGSIKIMIEQNKNIITLSITDTGNGFEVVGPNQHEGISKIGQRAASINAELELKTENTQEKGIFLQLTTQSIMPFKEYV